MTSYLFPSFQRNSENKDIKTRISLFLMEGTQKMLFQKILNVTSVVVAAIALKISFLQYAIICYNV